MPKQISVTAKINPTTGMEGRGSWADKLKELVGVIGPTQAANPVYMPFAPGTPTLATNQLMEQARSNAVNEALRAREASAAEARAAAPTIPTSTTAKYAVRTAALGSALEGWHGFLSSLGLGEGQMPNASEAEQWINKTLPGLKAGIYDQMLQFGGGSEDAEDVSRDVENFLRTRAGLAPRTKDSGGSENDIRAMLGLPPRE